MFTWICPQCGREVPPAYDECPDCAARTARGTPPATAGNPADSTPQQQSLDPAQPETVSSFQPARPASPLFEAPPPARPPYPQQARGGTHIPTWLLALLFALVFVVVGGGVYWFITHQRAQTAPTAVVESPAAKPGGTQNPLQKFIEVTGVRFMPSSKGVVIKFVVINHSPNDLAGVSGNATIWASTQRSEEDAVGTVAFQVGLAAGASQELTLPFTTKHKLAEIPEWQNLTVDVQITAPSGA